MTYILLADGFEEIEALTPLDMLRRASVAVKTVSITPERLVMGAHGIPVLADLTLEEAGEAPRLLVLPGGMPGAANLDASPFVSNLLEKTVEGGGRVAAICAAPMILGHRGLLKGKRAVCFPGFEKELEGAKIENLPVVTDGNITTAVGMGAAVLFGAELVRLLTSNETADGMLSAILYPQNSEKSNKEKRDVFDISAEAVSGNEEDLFDRAVEIALENGKISTSLLQRRLLVGFGKAARMIDRMQEMGIVSEPNGQRPRDVLISYDDYERMRLK